MEQKHFMYISCPATNGMVDPSVLKWHGRSEPIFVSLSDCFLAYKARDFVAKPDGQTKTLANFTNKIPEDDMDG